MQGTVCFNHTVHIIIYYMLSYFLPDTSKAVQSHSFLPQKTFIFVYQTVTQTCSIQVSTPLAMLC